jgi:phenylacetate-CoA ligase
MKPDDQPYYNAEIETMSADAVRAMQEERLSRQLNYIYDRAPFYTRKLDAAGIKPGDVRNLDDLAVLPFTEKSELRQSQVDRPPLGAHAAVAMRDVVRVHASSGTTGTPSYVGITKYDKQRWIECLARSYWAQGLRPDDVFAMGMSIGFFVGGLPLSNTIEEIGATFLPIGTGASDRLLTSIGTMSATVLATTPSYALYLAEIAREKMGISTAQLGIKRLMVGAEPGGGIPEVRARIEQEWDAKCLESIGNADLITIHSAECDAQDGCHFLAPDYLIMEIIDPQSGKVLPLDKPVVEGELVLTHIDRQCNPMLRFRTRDRVTVSTGPCSCGRTSPRLRCIGRSDDMLIVRGVNVWPSAIKDVVMSFAPQATGEMQIILNAPPPAADPPVHIKVEAAAGNDSSDLAKRIEQRLREKLIFAAQVELVPYGQLPRTEMKARLIEHNYRSDS